jgi:hypothetical protein
MTPEQREERAAELEHEIGREWIRFVVAEVIVLWVPVVILLVWAYVTDRISEAWVMPVGIAGGVVCGALITYWLIWRIRPLQKELQALREG